MYFNYKEFHSLVLLALLIISLIWCDISACGSSSDSQIFLYSDVRQNIHYNTIALPLAESLVDHGLKLEYFFIGDNNFPL